MQPALKSVPHTISRSRQLLICTVAVSSWNNFIVWIWYTSSLVKSELSADLRCHYKTKRGKQPLLYVEPKLCQRFGRIGHCSFVGFGSLPPSLQNQPLHDCCFVVYGLCLMLHIVVRNVCFTKLYTENYATLSAL